MAGTVESPLPRDWYGGFGERSGETGRWQHRNRAPDRLNECRPSAPIDRTAYAQADIRLKLPRRSGPPITPGNASAPGSSLTKTDQGGAARSAAGPVSAAGSACARPARRTPGRQGRMTREFRF